MAPREIQEMAVAKRSIIDYICSQVKWPRNTPPEIRIGFHQVCVNGNLRLIDTSPSEYYREHRGRGLISVYVEAQPLVLTETINVTAKILDRQIPMIGSGEGLWYAEYQDLGLLCHNNFEVIFRAFWEAKPEDYEFLYPRSTEIHRQKTMVGSGIINFSPSPSYPSEICYIQLSGGYYEGYCRVSFGILNFLGPGSEITVNGHQVYCRGADGLWRPWQDGDPWKIFDFQQLDSPRVLHCGEAIYLELACNQPYIEGLVIIQTNNGDIFKTVMGVEPPSG